MLEIFPKFGFHFGQRARLNLRFQHSQTTSLGSFNAMESVFQEVVAPIKSDSNWRDQLAAFESAYVHPHSLFNQVLCRLEVQTQRC
jgi:hypothetical protein